jgi:rare lipoprotein A
LLTSCSNQYNLERSHSYFTGKNNKVVPTKATSNSKAIHRATMRPYKVFGKTYYPRLVSIGDTFSGVASWYGPNFHNKKTSNGEIYNMHGLTAASKTLPMNTMVEVINLENRKKVIVRINDRGPFVKQRIIDLSNKAAKIVDMTKKGTAKVRIKIIGFNGKIATTQEQKQQQISFDKYYVQVGAFSKKKSAYLLAKKFNLVLDGKKAILKTKRVKQKTFNLVWIGYFRSEDEAIDFIADNKLANSLIIAK